MKNKKKVSGFTLIELMIAVAIIGILSSIAFPAYIDYIRRAQVTEAILIAKDATYRMIEYHSVNGTFVENYSDWDSRNDIVGLNSTLSYKTKYIDQLWVGSRGVSGLPGEDSGHVAIRLNSEIFGAENRRILFTVTSVEGEYYIYCADRGDVFNFTNIDDKYLPTGCRGTDTSNLY